MLGRLWLNNARLFQDRWEAAFATAEARLFGSRSAAAKRATMFAVLDIPFAATHRYVVAPPRRRPSS